MMATNMHAINVQEQKKNVRSVQTDHEHAASRPLHLGNGLLVKLGELQLRPQQKPEVHLRQSKIRFQRWTVIIYYFAECQITHYSSTDNTVVVVVPPFRFLHGPPAPSEDGPTATDSLRDELVLLRQHLSTAGACLSGLISIFRPQILGEGQGELPEWLWPFDVTVVPALLVAPSENVAGPATPPAPTPGSTIYSPVTQRPIYTLTTPATTTVGRSNGNQSPDTLPNGPQLPVTGDTHENLPDGSSLAAQAAIQPSSEVAPPCIDSLVQRMFNFASSFRHNHWFIEKNLLT